MGKKYLNTIWAKNDNGEDVLLNGNFIVKATLVKGTGSYNFETGEQESRWSIEVKMSDNSEFVVGRFYNKKDAVNFMNDEMTYEWKITHCQNDTR